MPEQARPIDTHESALPIPAAGHDLEELEIKPFPGVLDLDGQRRSLLAAKGHLNLYTTPQKQHEKKERRAKTSKVTGAPAPKRISRLDSFCRVAS